MPDDYTVRYVAFVDILGFRSLIRKLNHEPHLLSELRTLLEKLHSTDQLDIASLVPDSDFRSNSISDAVAISTSPTDQGLMHLIGVVEYLTMYLLRLGYFIRGAVVKGPVFHHEKIMLGPALVDAYTLESTIVKYPRVMLTKEVMKDLHTYKDQESPHAAVFKKCFRRSGDGPYFVHGLRTLEGRRAETQTIERIVSLRNNIAARLDDAVDTPAHYEKIHWFAGYFNDVFYNTEGVAMIKAPGLEIGLALE